MSNLTPTAQAALLNGGVAGIVRAAGGAVRVALFRSGVEASGHGYARKATSEVDLADATDSASYVDVGPVTFTASGGSIVYDQARVYNRAGTVLLGQTALTDDRTIAPGAPHDMTVRFQIPAAADANLGDAEQLGAVPRDPANPITIEEAEANSVVFNDWHNQGWRRSRRKLGLEGRRWAVGPAIDTQMMAGVGWSGTGMGGFYAESQYGGDIDPELSDNGGPATGLVAFGDDYLGDPLVISRGRGWDMGTFNFYGVSDENDPSNLPGKPRRAEAIRCLGRDVLGRMPSGKWMGNAGFFGFGTCIKTLPTPFEDNADQFDMGRIQAHYCDRFFHSTNKNTLGATFDYVDQFYCPDAFVFERGGEFHAPKLCMQTGAERGLVIRGNGEGIVGYFDLDHVILDGSGPGDALIVDIEGTDGYPIPFVRIGKTEINSTIVGRTEAPCIRAVNTFGTIEIRGLCGTGCGWERMIHVEHSTDARYPLKVFVYSSAFRQGCDLNTIRKMFTASSFGAVLIYFAGDNYEVFGDGSGANAGFYNEFIGKVRLNNNDTLTAAPW